MGHPQARRLDLSDPCRGHVVHDPYRCLEQLEDPATGAWNEAQDASASAFLNSLPGRDRIRDRLRELLPGFIGPPHIVGDRAFSPSVPAA